jgi:hypothetical protein
LYYDYISKRQIKRSATIKEWIKDGGQAEDGRNLGLRYFNHFHDPLRAWEDAGWGGSDSSIAWSQDEGPMIDNNVYSWGDVRTYYYNALVYGTENYWAKTFRGVGQLIHLVSDLAVPAHVRQDIHPGWLDFLFYKLKSDFYEEWTKENSDHLENNINGIKISSEIFNQANPQSTTETEIAPVAISALWDQNVYNIGTDPDITLTSQVGLAEYTNANFLSQDSMFEGYEYPQDNGNWIETIDWLDPSIEVAEDSLSDHRYYIMSDIGEANPIRLAGASFITRESCLYGNVAAPHNFYQLDDRVMEDYANVLVPRAIGYSAALIDYFFRGKLAISPPDQYVYAIIDGGDIDPTENTQYIKQLKAKVRNDTPGEEMLAGSLVAIAKYKKLIGYQPDLSSGSPTANMREADFSYSTSTAIDISTLSSVTPEEFSFDFKYDPIPVGITDLYLQVVFKGTLGHEEQLAVAVGMKDLNEPQHLTIWNDTDYFLLEGVSVTADYVRNNNPAVESYAYIDPYTFTETLGFSASFPDVDSPSIVAMEDLPPARHARIIVVTDSGATPYFVTDHAEGYPPPEEPDAGIPIINDIWKYSLPTATHQEDSAGVWQSSPVYNVRGIFQHQRVYLMNYYPWFAYINSLPAPPENVLGPFPATVN